MSDTIVRPVRICEATSPRTAFVPVSFARPSLRTPAAHHGPFDNAGEPLTAIDRYEQGLADGRRAAEENFAAERAALLGILEKASALQSEPSEELATLIGETVYRLVTDIVGRADIDRDCLARRAKAAAGLIAECDNARTLCVNPDDLPLLEGLDTTLTLSGDASLPRGDLRIDCSAGWIEHGTSLYLEALRSELGVAEDCA